MMPINSRTPTRWNDDRPRQAYECALLGATEKEIARIMGINIATLELWKNRRPEFAEQLEAGKVEADAKVAHAFYRCATGYEYTEEFANVDRAGVPHKMTLKKYQKPESWAANKWLGIRRRADWSETQRIEIQNTNINITKIDLSVFSTQELALLEKMGVKQLTENAGNN